MSELRDVLRGCAMGRTRHRILALLAIAALSFTGLVSPFAVAPASAVSGSEFDPGMIISDELFYDGNAMTASQIQSFLDGKIGVCLSDRCLNVAVVPFVDRGSSYSTSTGALICSAIAGGSLRVSELIYRVQSACGISAKVILATLQKEQGLVTSRSPSDWALRAAMGMGCPDTAPCDDAFSGVANQIYSGTRQLKIYKAAAFGRQPGAQFVPYSPNSSCGGTTVNVRNYATAALYNYTPYQPNAAALANLSGVGDSCSSYGNRNFWRFYSDWFGSTIEIPCTVNPASKVAQFWQDQGGEAGVLGSPVTPGIVVGPGGVTVGYYTNGAVYCTPVVGPTPVLGEIATKYSALGAAGGSLGAPTNPRLPWSASGVVGYMQSFKQGLIMSSGTTGTFAVLNGPVRNEWGARGGSGGPLGWPVGNQAVLAGGIRQPFQNGQIVARFGQPTIVLSGAINAYWSSGSNAAKLGLPISAPIDLTAKGVTGLYQIFENGMVLSSATTGTYAVLNGAIRDAWGALSGTGGPLGWPSGDAVADNGGYRQAFQGGMVVVSENGTGASLSGSIAAYWSTGSNSVLLGYPLASARPWIAGGVDGVLQEFERGLVMSSATTGTFAVLNGLVRDAWGARGGSGGSLGWPTGDQEIVGGNLQQQFQNGTVKIPPTTGLSDAIAAYWLTGSNSTILGNSLAPAVPHTANGVSGWYQVFQYGMVVSTPTTGTYAVLNGTMRNIWGALGGSGGQLGWPTGDQERVAAGARQKFQFGAISAPTQSSAFALTGAIATYWLSGTNSDRLGVPISSGIPWTAGGVSGTYQTFSNGMVMSSTSTGTLSVMNGPVRNLWGANGGSGGPFGWPTSELNSISGGSQQQFQHGVIIVPNGGTAVSVIDPIAAYWSGGSNASLLGFPTAAAQSVTVDGTVVLSQEFARGIALSTSGSGTYAILNGPIRTRWASLGGLNGPLGWPTSAQEASAGIVRQSFNRGLLSIASGGTVVVLSGDYYAYWKTGSNAAQIGPPTTSAIPWTASGISGSYQNFEKAIVMSSPETGTHAVMGGPIRTLWGSLNGSGGPLGWPLADQETDLEGSRQQFQHGTIVVPNSGDPYVVMN